MPLTDTQLRKAKATDQPIKLTDGGGLYLEVRPTGTRLWRYRYRIGGKENLFAIGEYPSISLAEARERRAEARKLVKQGLHPARERKTAMLAALAANANTFEAVAREWMEQKKSRWTPYYARQIEKYFIGDVFPFIGRLPLRSVTAAHLLEIMRRVESRGAATTAILVRQWCSAVFRYGVATLRADGDPAAALRGAVHRPKTKHAKALSRSDLEKFSAALARSGGYRTTVIALKLMLLTFVRTKELRQAAWSEFDLDRAEWRIPGPRMKMREAHVVPLSRQAVTLLIELQTYTGGQTFLLPNYRTSGTCMTATTLNRALERMGFAGKGSIGFSAHGFRTTASTMLNERGFRPEVIDRQLAHAQRNKVRASYNHAEYMEERCKMMQVWADLTDEFIAKGH